MAEYNMTGRNNICIGENAGVEITTERNILCLRSKSIEVDEVMTEREYKLIKATIDCLIELGRIN